MTAAVPEDGSSLSSSAGPRSQTPPWPLAEPCPAPAAAAAAAADGKDAGAARQQQEANTGVQSWLFEGQQSGKKRRWWATRRAKMGFAAGAVLLAAFVVLLTLGLLGYLKKVGPFASLINNHQSTPEPPANPLSTIPLMSDPFATPATAPTPTPTSQNFLGVATPTNQPTINAVSYCERPCLLSAVCHAMPCHAIFHEEGVMRALDTTTTTRLLPTLWGCSSRHGLLVRLCGHLHLLGSLVFPHDKPT